MATVTITHSTVTGAAANLNALVDGPKWDANHVVTGLENVDNTSDVNKPISTATQTALDAKVTGPASATDDLPAIFDGTTGKLIKSKTYAAFKTLLALVKGDVGLGNVDNTSDANKPVSTAQAAADALKANIASPTLTGVPAAPTAAVGTNTTQLATTAFVLANGSIAPPQGRLTLTTAVAITTADVTGATSIFFTPVGGATVPIWSGTAFAPTAFSELTLALDSTNTDTGYHQSGKNFDCFVANDAGTVRLGTGPAWTSDTARGTGAGTTELDFSKSAIPTNKNTMTLRFGSATGNTISVAANQATYVGSFRATANGQATDSKALRLLFNAYNQASRILRVADPAASWTYSVAAWRQANGSTSNQIDVLFGLGGVGVSLQSLTFCASSTATNRNVRSGIGLDSTSNIASFDSTGAVAAVSNVGALVINSYYNGYPGLGKYSLTWIEYGGGTDVQTWFATDTTNAYFYAGLTGSMLS